MRLRDWVKCEISPSIFHVLNIKALFFDIVITLKELYMSTDAALPYSTSCTCIYCIIAEYK